MASFTDIIPQFTPYVQQAPVQALVEVGMEKQRRYDEGIQKIQANIENIAGLPVVRDIDKAYLQSKLNELGGKLKTVAAGDFSNFQLVNSVGGMANQIIKDPLVQNAVSSAARYKKELETLQAARAKGESSPSNEWVFNTAASNWLNSADPKSSFDGYYQPYVNWKKNALEVIKGLTKDETITDDAFTLDASGKLVIADAIVRKKMSGISADKIQEALLNTLTPGDFNQMKIDALYNYSNQDGEKFRGTINSTYDNRIRSYADQITILENAKLSTTSAVEKDKLNDQILSINKMINSIGKEKSALLGAIDSGNIDAAKAQFGTQNAIAGIADSFSYSQISQTYENNPFVDVSFKREQIRNQVQQFWAKYNQDERQNAIQNAFRDKEIRLKEAEQKAAQGYGGVLTGQDLANVLGVSADNIGAYLLADTQRKIESGETQLNTLKTGFLKSVGKDEKWLAQQEKAWEANPNGVDPIVGSYFNQVANVQREVFANQMMLANLDAEADAQFGTVDRLIPKNAPNITYTTKSGVREVYTPKDFVEFNNMLPNYIGFAPTGGAMYESTRKTYDVEKARKELSPKMFRLFEIMRKAPGTLSGADETLAKNIQNYKKIVNEPFKEVIKQRNDFMAKEIQNRMTVNQPGIFNIPAVTEPQKESLANLLTGFMQLSERPGGLANSPEWDNDIASALRQDPNFKWSIRVAEGTTVAPEKYEVTVSGKAGQIRFNLTPEQKRQAFGNEFESSPAVQMVAPYYQQMNRSGGFTTAFDPSAGNTWQNSYLNPIDFPSIRNYGVKANLQKPFGQGENVSLRLSIFDPITGKFHEDIPFPRTGSIPKEKVAEALINLNDSNIYELINEKAPTANDLKRLQQATKKPR